MRVSDYAAREIAASTLFLMSNFGFARIGTLGDMLPSFRFSLRQFDAGFAIFRSRGGTVEGARGVGARPCCQGELATPDTLDIARR